MKIELTPQEAADLIAALQGLLDPKTDWLDLLSTKITCCFGNDAILEAIRKARKKPSDDTGADIPAS
ncbi:MAG: hypothetical protein FWD43_02765 [Coriobacteriia bacterium]|nr:hypothetical protein [Coriobacteriia bacterium]